MKKRLAGYWDSFSFVGLAVATLFFSASVTPSLLPRNYLVQGLLSGFSLAIGYVVGVALVAIYQFLQLREPTGKTQLICKFVIVVSVAIVLITFSWRMTFWQNSIRELMEMQPLTTAYPYRVVTIALVFGAFLVTLGRCFLWSGNYISTKLKHFVPDRIASAIGFIIVVVVLLFVTNEVIASRLLNAADSFFLKMDQIVDDDVMRPDPSHEDESEESLVSWDSIGRQGKVFLSGRATQADLSEFHGPDTMDPIRVYVGMRSRETPRERAELALEELKRVGGFQRSVLVVATPTGTGWLDPSAVDTLEYLHGGDTAIVSMQYSYLPSWITILVDPQRSIASAEELFTEIYSYWKTLPKDSRPRLYLHGLSLGSLGSEVSADLFTIFEDPIQGAVWSGPPFPSQNWNLIVKNRNEGSPIWLPKFRDSRMLRFTAQRNALQEDVPWGPMRSVYVQYASDPMIWFSPDLAWSRPDWLGEKRGPDVSPHLRWYPIVTFLQVAFDLPVATAVPLGYGHNYSPSSYIDSWIAVTQPKDWTDEKTRALKAKFDERKIVGP